MDETASKDSWFDPDIEAMDLDYEQKSGLQIYRNYTRSFEDHAVKRFRQTLDREELDLSSLRKLVNLLISDDLRFLPVVLCAFADELLEEAFKSALPEGVPGGKANMFSGYGPLSDLSKRIRLAFAFDVMSADLMKDLDRVRAARNKIAHNWDAADLNDFYLSGRSADLFPVEVHLAEIGAKPQIVLPVDPASAFRIRLVWIAGRLAYESAFYDRAKKARLSPLRALYDSGGTTKWLKEIAIICMKATETIIKMAANRSEEDGPAIPV